MSVRGDYSQDWLLKETDWNWRLQPEEGGELRAVGDIGTHWMDLILFVTGLDIDSVFADLATLIPVRLRPKSALATFQIDHAGGGHNEGFPDTFKQLYRAIYDYLAEEDYSRPKLFASFADGHREMVLCEAILKSHRAERWVRVTNGGST
jgi:predicted dehydrogenase